MLQEEEVYLGSKNYLIKCGFDVLAGQPPRGVDHLPVIEIKDDFADKGSKFSYKPDLVAHKNGVFIIIECKPSFNLGDYIKLKSVLNSPVRMQNFYNELKQYHLFEKVRYNEPFDEFAKHLKISLAYSGKKNSEYTDVDYIIVSDWQGKAISSL